MAEHNQRFETFQTWVNKASSWLTRRGDEDKAICFDAKGQRCKIGADFMRARDEEAFPVYWVWESDVPNMALSAMRANLDIGYVLAQKNIENEGIMFFMSGSRGASRWTPVLEKAQCFDSWEEAKLAIERKFCARRPKVLSWAEADRIRNKELNLKTGVL